MSRLWTRDDWNNIIRRVNDLSTNPPAGCDAWEPLPEVGPHHKWSTIDILAVRSRLFDMCNDSTFNTLAYKWKQDLIDEINTAIDNGWCGCEDQWTGPYTVENPLQHDTRNEFSYTEPFDLGGQGWNPDCCQLPSVTGVDSGHRWDDVYYWPPGDLQVGPAGITGRTIKLHISGTINYHEVRHYWVGEVNGGWYDFANDWSEPFTQEGAPYPLPVDGYFRRTEEGIFKTCNNGIQNTQSNCVTYEYRGESITTYSIDESYFIVDRP